MEPAGDVQRRGNSRRPVSGKPVLGRTAEGLLLGRIQFQEPRLAECLRVPRAIIATRIIRTLSWVTDPGCGNMVTVTDKQRVDMVIDAQSADRRIVTVTAARRKRPGPGQATAAGAPACRRLSTACRSSSVAGTERGSAGRRRRRCSAAPESEAVSHCLDRAAAVGALVVFRAGHLGVGAVAAVGVGGQDGVVAEAGGAARLGRRVPSTVPWNTRTPVALA